ncbi:hypothetical protein TraAM80_01527 [Trypanosoma rangeli]|uniref:RING-type domain-containing protein n=1 Tax=Trypanosoma rangeli TaxID=5698 RepID=A0A3R7KVC5_TRYRA|nr:uncharacterized protein TraAM80_01527 [Trypanosoma rangeli]RNF10481.1 hypothetical protein TraAM80_01527 [Trypanosoma rangeli]|eukprot:RNF10481.1 hypothetical protein TraAM80_01527 [Trypanosoma rangeli]
MPKKNNFNKKEPSFQGDSLRRRRKEKQEAPAKLQDEEDFKELQELLEDETHLLDEARSPLEYLLSLRQPQELALRLTQSLVSLRSRLAELELERLNNESGMPGRSDVVARRAQEKAEKLELEIHKTERVLRRLMLMSKVMEQIISLRKDTIAGVRTEMEAEVRLLQEKFNVNEELIRGRYVDRVNMLHRYWLWRTLQELGDQTVSRTFEEELSCGPRYRSLGVQNNILSDTLEQQLAWMVRFSERERIFRDHVRRLDILVEELTDVNEAIEESLTCRVCGLFFEDPVLFWPCGHTFCLTCFDSLSIAPSLFRCPTCGSMGSEGYVHNLLIAECVAKWMFKDSGYADINGALSLIRLHLSKFRKEIISARIAQYRQRLADALHEESKPVEPAYMDIEYRAF